MLARPALLASLALVALSGLTGCASLVPFTHEIRTEHGLTDDEVKNLQFYSSHGITLRREVESGGRKITPGHKLLLISGKQIEEVVIPAKTPGVAVKVGPRALAVSFEPGTSLVFTVKGSRLAMDERGFLRPLALDPSPASPFERRVTNLLGQQFAQPPNPFPGNDSGNEPLPGSSTVAGDDASGNYWLDTDSAGRISFAGKLWNSEEDSMQAHLLIDSDLLEEVDKKRNVLHGVKLEPK
ncbi:DNA-directed RNA polymerase [Polyangium mundeleinium]|uniref:DNA-directed RNA polymerase n=1 Tax=Polyangium mundeleinium TaxID=2995306 RepID=A0ABT5F5H2_9BACT|nr:DNA-directed RNA polymerase [Polyangium mundeleinium]MDC0748869.1 DNA-directed RNA polymerase [Polyangium mundeleinium]